MSVTRMVVYFFPKIFRCFDVDRIDDIRLNLGIVECRLRLLKVCIKGGGHTGDRF